MRKDELNEFGNSLDFLSSKYDESAKSANEMRESLDFQWTENKGLCERVSMIESMVVACDSEMENMKQIQTFNKNLLLAKLHKFINDTVGFV